MLMMSRRLFAPLILTLIAASVPLNLLGQAVSGNIISTVTDPSGAGVPGAPITIKNVGTNASYQTQTNESGNYTAANLAPGTYTVTIPRRVFKSSRSRTSM
jgi:hypothetical protein